MYTEADRVQERMRYRKRLLITMIPGMVCFAGGVVVFVVGQLQRQPWGWIVASILTILGGSWCIFMQGVYLRPVALYRKHLDYMLDGRMRQTNGVLQHIAQVPTDKDGLDCYALIVNVGEKQNPEDERLLYFDARKGEPPFTEGTRVQVLSNDKMISSIQEG